MCGTIHPPRVKPSVCLVGRARALVDAVERDELGQRESHRVLLRFGDGGELRGDRAPAVGEPELFVVRSRAGVGVPDDDAVVGALADGRRR